MDAHQADNNYEVDIGGKTICRPEHSAKLLFASDFINAANAALSTIPAQNWEYIVQGDEQIFRPDSSSKDISEIRVAVATVDDLVGAANKEALLTSFTCKLKVELASTEGLYTVLTDKRAQLFIDRLEILRQQIEEHRHDRHQQERAEGEGFGVAGMVLPPAPGNENSL